MSGIRRPYPGGQEENAFRGYGGHEEKAFRGYPVYDENAFRGYGIHDDNGFRGHRAPVHDENAFRSYSVLDDKSFRRYPGQDEKMFRHPAPDLEDDRDRKRLKLRVVLNTADCNLDFKIHDYGLSGSALHERGFAYCWSGARANVGIRGGRYCFGCKITGLQEVDTPDTAPDQRNLCRLGISRGDTDVGCLGESKNSFGYGGSGKFSTAGNFRDYGEKFGVGDLIVCAVDLESRPLAKISFAKNGRWLGAAREFQLGPGGIGIIGGSSETWQGAVFPHVLLKNVTVQMQFSIHDGLMPVDGYKPWDAAMDNGHGIAGPKLGSTSECEVLMMVGLPGSGKTTWAEHWTQTHPEKRYVVIGTNLALDQMKVPGLQRKKNYAQRWEQLMSRATEIFNTLLDIAAHMPHNYIIDQTNVYLSARKRKMRQFVGFCKIAVVVVAKEEEHARRVQARAVELGKEVPVEAINEMKANFVIPKSKDMPKSEEPFDEVWFVEAQRQEAEQIVQRDKNRLIPGKQGARTDKRHGSNGLGIALPPSERHIPAEQQRGGVAELARTSTMRLPIGPVHQPLPMHQVYSQSLLPTPIVSSARGLLSHDAKGLVTGIPLPAYETMRPVSGVSVSPYERNSVSPYPMPTHEQFHPTLGYRAYPPALPSLPSSGILGAPVWPVPVPVPGTSLMSSIGGLPHPMYLPLPHSMSPELRGALLHPPPPQVHRPAQKYQPPH